MSKMNHHQKFNSIVLGGGCFWCLEAVYNRVEGVKEVVSGYAGGKTKNPSYEEVSSGTTGHAEVVKVIYYPSKITLKSILEIFFQMHDPTTLNRQGNDIGTQYRSIILYETDEEKELIQEVIKEVENNSHWKRPVVTEFKQLKEFYKAEDYHQNYYEKNPKQGYCRVVIDPKINKLTKKVLPKLEYTALNE